MEEAADREQLQTHFLLRRCPKFLEVFILFFVFCRMTQPLIFTFGLY
jgi:hypothetical protein